MPTESRAIHRNRKFGKFFEENLPLVIEAIEHAQKSKKKTGAQRLDVAATFLAGKFDIPMLPEWVEVLIVKTALTVTVELAKAIWGRRDWFPQLKTALSERHNRGRL